MNKYVTGFDIETSGLNTVEDHIIQLSMVKFSLDDFVIVKEHSWYILPEVDFTINPDAEKVHGISKEHILKEGVPLRKLIPDITDMFLDADYLTYNGNSFDVKFLYNELQRVGYEFPMENKVFYDAFLLYKTLHPNTLSAVYKRYTGKDLEGAHDAMADIKATMEVFKCVQQEYDTPFEVFAEMPESQMISPEGSIRNAANIGEGEHIVFAFGKYKDSDFIEVMHKDPPYIRWWGDNIASGYTKRYLNEYVKKMRNKS